MPIFDIDLDNIHNTDHKITAVMLYPDDPEQRQEFLVCCEVASMLAQGLLDKDIKGSAAKVTLCL